jgi:hypothetical protein
MVFFNFGNISNKVTENLKYSSKRSDFLNLFCTFAMSLMILLVF